MTLPQITVAKFALGDIQLKVPGKGRPTIWHVSAEVAKRIVLATRKAGVHADQAGNLHLVAPYFGRDHLLIAKPEVAFAIRDLSGLGAPVATLPEQVVEELDLAALAHNLPAAPKPKRVRKPKVVQPALV